MRAADVRKWWVALSGRARERVLLGALVGVALAARDVVLLLGAAGAFAGLEAADHLAPRARAAA